MVTILVMTAEPFAAMAHSLFLVPARLTALRIVSPTASTSEIVFSAIAALRHDFQP